VPGATRRPQVELEEHSQRAAQTKLLDLGLLPFLLVDELLSDLLSFVRAHIARLAVGPGTEGLPLHVERHFPHRQAPGGRIVIGREP